MNKFKSHFVLPPLANRVRTPSNPIRIRSNLTPNHIRLLPNPIRFQSNPIKPSPDQIGIQSLEGLSAHIYNYYCNTFEIYGVAHWVKLNLFTCVNLLIIAICCLILHTLRGKRKMRNRGEKIQISFCPPPTGQ